MPLPQNYAPVQAQRLRVGDFQLVQRLEEQIEALGDLRAGYTNDQSNVLFAGLVNRVSQMSAKLLNLYARLREVT